jgi:hypothetical protein
MKNMNKQSYFAEVIESSLPTWRAQSWQWDTFPSFGSLVTITAGDRTLFGLVYEIQTGSLDPHRSTFAYQKTEEELKKEQPQIFEFLRTTFSCLTIGYLQEDKIVYQLAPEPPKIHAFLSYPSNNQLQHFFSSEHYLHLIFNASGYIGSLDELLLALLNRLAYTNILTEQTVARFIETFSLLTANDYRRLKLFLQRVSFII